MPERVYLQLLSRVAHDLRSPLTVISGTAMALRATLPESAREGLDRILRETQRLGRMLENRVAFAQILSGAPLARELVTVEELAATALARLDALHGQRSFEFQIEPDTTIDIDARLGQLAIGNLLDNAARYSPAGTSIQLVARRSITDDQPPATVVDILDHGSGKATMPSDDATHASGLVVARAIVLAHGGTLEAIRGDAGTCIRVRIPDGGSSDREQ